jgi:hypothetical protein
MDQYQFKEAAKEVGFTDEQIGFMVEWLAQTNHGHNIEDVAGLEEKLDEIEEDEEEEEDDE